MMKAKAKTMKTMKPKKEKTIAGMGKSPVNPIMSTQKGAKMAGPKKIKAKKSGK